jgi:BAR domain
MSSVLSLFTQQAKEVMGVAAKTQDGDLLSLMSRLFDLDKDAQALRKALQTMARVLLEQVPASRIQATNVINEIFGKTVPGGSSTTEALSSFNDAHSALNKDIPKKMEAAFEKAVLNLMEEWIDGLTTTKKELSDVETKRVTYDHYRSKMEGLQEAKRKSLLRGKATSKQEEERISRNQEKLQSASTDYFTARDNVCGRILQLLREAPQRVETILLRVIQFEKEVRSLRFCSVYIMALAPCYHLFSPSFVLFSTPRILSSLFNATKGCFQAYCTT